MKQTYLTSMIVIIVSLLLNVGVLAQEPPMTRIVTARFDAKECSFSGSTAPETINGATVNYNNQESVGLGAKIVITNSTQDAYVFYFVEYEDATLKARFNTKIISGRNELLYFLLPKGLLETHTREYSSFASPTFGAISLPFKLRPGANVSTQFSLAATGGIRLAIRRRTEVGVSVLVGAGLTTVNLHKFNTDPEISEPTQRSAITIPIGAVFQWHKLQVGSFIGFDFIPDGALDGWKNHGKIWWGLGVGFAVFTTEDTRSTPTGTQ